MKLLSAYDDGKYIYWCALPAEMHTILFIYGTWLSFGTCIKISCSLSLDFYACLFDWGGVGNKASATVQPFRLLHLDIHPEAVRTIEDALHLFSAPESLEGYRTSTTGKVISFLSMVFVVGFWLLVHFLWNIKCCWVVNESARSVTL